MRLLQDKILAEGRVEDGGVLKVDSFLNHQIDVELYNKIGIEFFEKFKDRRITKILTIEASGIGIACITAQYFKVPVVFAKKSESKNLDNDTFESEVFSFTKDRNYKIRVSKKYINKEDRILIIDDFLANGKAVIGLSDITKQAGASIKGVGIVIEKGFQDGGRILRSQGLDVYSLAIIKSMKKGIIEFE